LWFILYSRTLKKSSVFWQARQPQRPSLLDADVKEIVVPTLRRAHSDRCALELPDYPLYESFNEILLKPFLLFRRPKPASGTARVPA
jgi:hypothetical protein